MEIFMVVRHHEIDFASGALVFPGGSVEPADRQIAARPELFSGAEGCDLAARALRVAAVRETFEECGILLARPRGASALVDAAWLKAMTQAAGDKPAAFMDFVIAEGLVLALDLLVPFAHWITPVMMPKRFDTYFFLVVAPADQVGVHDGHEAVESVWISPRRALDEARAGRFTVLFPTERNLVRLARASSAAEAIARARNEPIVTVMPELSKGDRGQRQLRIPKDAGYDGELFDI
jgi:8-oxo-dGTP pyrophosphatase MutT (NUDIX family)